MSTPLTFDIFAKDHASSTFNHVGKEVGGLHGKTVALGAATGIAMQQAATHVFHFAESAIGKFAEVGKETIKLRRYMGGTAEDVSRLRFAAEESGIGADQLAKGLGFLSKASGHAADDFAKFAEGQAKARSEGKAYTGHLGAAGAAFGALGVHVTDASGKLRPMHDILLDSADAISHMDAGAEKTALTMKIFGKSGMDLLPFLNRGKDGIKELEAESDKLGNTMSDKDLSAVHENIMAQREFHATIQGLEITLGRDLYPTLTKMATGLSSTVQWMEKNKAVVGPLIGIIAILAGGIAAVNLATRLWGATTAAWSTIQSLFVKRSVEATAATEGQTVAQGELDAAMDANPIGIVVLAIAALAAGFIYAYKHSETFRNIVHDTFHVVSEAGQFMWNILKDVFKFLTDAFLTVAGTIIHGAADMFGWVPGVGGKLKDAAAKFDDFRDDVNNALNGVHNAKTVSMKVEGGQQAIDTIATLNWQLAHVPRSVTIGVVNHVSNIPMNAGGTRNFPGGLSWVGEEGPELVSLPQGANIYSNTESMAMAGASGLAGTDEQTLTVNLVLDGNVIHTSLLKVKRTKGGAGLGLG